MLNRLLILWPWVSAVLGLAVTVVSVIYDGELGDWADRHAAFSLPASGPAFLIEFLGIVILIGGCVQGAAAAGTRRRRRDQQMATGAAHFR